MTTLSHLKSILTVAFCSAIVAGAMGTIGTAEAGRGGSDARIRSAVNSGSTTAIIAEVERAERLACAACIDTVMGLLEHPEYEVREVAAWWFARRAAQKEELTERSLAYLLGADSIDARNAADILGAFRSPASVPALSAAATRSDLSAEARRHAVRALGFIRVQTANPALAAAMSDGDAGVRLEAVTAWLRIPRQTDATPVAALLSDSDVLVRRSAAAVIGNLRDATSRTALEAMLSDSDTTVRSRAAWALGRIGDLASLSALRAATDDSSPLVRSTARAAIRKLR